MNLSKQLRHPIFKLVGQIADQKGIRAFAIGGYVRDILLGREVKDIDIVVEGSGIEVAEAAAKQAGIRKVTTYKNFGTAMFRFMDAEIEFVGARKESYRRESRKPIVEDGTIEDDQKRRDFTINALAISINNDTFGELIDPFGGLIDLEAGVIRTPLDPDITFSDDPLRMMRAVRFSAQLRFSIHPEAVEAISRNRKRIHIVSGERISTELNKIILSKKPGNGFKTLYRCGLLQEIFPEFILLKGVEKVNGVSHKDNFFHTLEVLDNVAAVSDNLWLRWSAILHDIAKPQTKRYYPDQGWTFHGHEEKGARMVPRIFKRMKLPMDHKMKYVQKLVQLHLRPIALTKEEISDSAIRRLLFDAGDDIDDLMVLCRADITSKNEEKVARYLQNYDIVKQKLIEVEQKDHVRNFQPPISGELIMQTFNIPPSHEVGLIKNAIKEAILEGEIHNDYHEAFAFMLARGKDLGLTQVA
jgi:poly(A) polymerase